MFRSKMLSYSSLLTLRPFIYSWQFMFGNWGKDARTDYPWPRCEDTEPADG